MRETCIDMPPPCAIFVHGAGGGRWEWNVWRRVFAAHHWRCSAADLPAAAAGLAATRLDDHIDQVVAAAQALRDGGAGIQCEPVLIGASLGGLLVLAAAAHVRPSALVLINPLPPAGIAITEHDEYAGDIVPWGSRRSLASTLRALPDADDAARLFAFRRWRDESAAVLRAARAGIPVAQPSCPVLVVASEFDDDVPPATSRLLAGSLGADLHVVAGASHVGPLLGRAAASIALDVLRWIERGAGSAGARRGSRD